MTCNMLLNDTVLNLLLQHLNLQEGHLLTTWKQKECWISPILCTRETFSALVFLTDDASGKIDFLHPPQPTAEIRLHHDFLCHFVGKT